MTGPSNYATAADGLFTLLFGPAGRGFAVIDVDRRASKGEQYVEHHAFPVQDRSLWLEALDTALHRNLSVRAWPWTYGIGVRKGIGTAAHNVTHGTNLRATQHVVQVRWYERPSALQVERFEGVGGHVLASTRREYVGLIPLSQAETIARVKILSEEAARTFGATSSTAPLSIAEGHGLAFVTDISRAQQVGAA